MTDLKMYSELAPWFHLLTAPEDYAEEAEFYRRAMSGASERPLERVLELGSGGGNNASHMKAHVALTLVDLSPEMLALSRTINPELEHIEGDMRSVRLDREFDAVFVHDAVVYMTAEADLRAAIETAAAHCRPGGVALFCPDHVRENFAPNTSHGGHDGADGRGVRYLDWMYDPDPSDTTYTTDFAYLLREADGSVRSTYERHIEGLFSTDTWLRLLGEAGFQPEAVPFVHSEEGPGLLMFVAKKPA
ncbi:MAG: class I SAM-dependent methyltransferase [Dehalococcoidia bacterium]